MSVMREIVENSLPVWKECLETDFVKQLVNGSLDEEKFKGYIIEDTLYLREYARVFAYAMHQSRSLKDIRVYYSLLGFVQENEDAVRAKYVKSWNLSDEKIDKMPMRETCRAYCEYMLSFCKEGQEKELLMATLPCMFSYYWIFDEALKTEKDAEKGRYWPLVREYVSENYLKLCEKWGAFAEEKLSGVTEEEKARLSEVFKKSSLFELDFWKMSFEKRDI